MSLPNCYERELAADFFFEVLPNAVVNWIQTGIETQEFRVDEDVVALADMLARYRVRLQRSSNENSRDTRRGWR